MSKHYVSTTHVRCPICGTLKMCTVMTNGQHMHHCDNCGTESSFQLAYISQPLVIPAAQSKVPATLDATDAEVDEALATCDRILEKCSEVPEPGEDFAASIQEKVESIQGWIVDNTAVTPAQLEALENMEGGLDRWIERA